MQNPLTRREFLATAATAAGIPAAEAGLLGGGGGIAGTFDVIVVGGGAAGLSAALGVKRADPSASVVVLEAKPSTGGTSFRSGGRLWIPNNADMRAAGLDDPKDMCLRYMARLSYPDRYDANDSQLGLLPRHYAQLSAYYDHGAEMLDWFRSASVMPWIAERGAYLPGMADPLSLNGAFAPDYRPDFAEDVPKGGRSIMPEHFDPTLLTGGADPVPVPNYGASLAGMDLIEWLRYSATRVGVQFKSGMRVHDVLLTREGGVSRVDGVVATVQLHGLPLPLKRSFRATRGVIFTSGGYSKNLDRLNTHFSGVRQFTGGGCAVTSAQGDFIDIAERHGLLLENMGQAWYIQNVYEQYKKDPDSELTPNYLLFQAYWPNGDSMVMVNRRGARVVNEKMNYHQRTQAHFQPDNRFLISVFDQHALTNFAAVGGHITPLLDTLIGPAATTTALTQKIVNRMNRDPQTAAFGLAPGFRAGLDATLARFADFARSGVDLDFHRGETSIDVWWHTFCLNFHGLNAGSVHDCISANVDPAGVRYPNPTLRPLAPPYWAVIMSSGLQDTNGGPAIDQFARVLDTSGQVVKRLYGAGNCVASPAGAGYWGAGGTLGPAVVFGHIAGRHAASGA